MIPSLNGVLLNKEDCRNIRVLSKGSEDAEFFQVSLQVSFVEWHEALMCIIISLC